MIRAIVGANWGDEGKGKITDMYAADSDLVIRFQGGANAGHTIINDKGRFALHLLPSGVCYSHTVNIIGNGVALNIPSFYNELSALKKLGINPKILISDRAQIVMPYHVGKQFGSTKAGIAPFYSDKYAKNGIQVCDLFDSARLHERIENILPVKNILLRELYHKPELDPDEIYRTLQSYKEMIAPYVADTFHYIYDAVESGKNILLEGQLGSLKDPDFGIYPFTTSSHTVAGFGAVGAGIPARKIEKVTTVVKAYSSAVGAGAFVSEIFGDEAEQMRRHGGDQGEYGATTGRPRRMGWFDAVATRYGCRVQGCTDVALTVLDALGYLDELQVCVGYEIDGKITKEFPVSPLLERAKPVLKSFAGWKCDIRGIRNYTDLPENCRAYVEFIEDEIGFPVKIVTNGPKREDVILR